MSLALVNPASEAVIVTSCVPSTSPSSTASIEKVTDASPAGIVTESGTVASVVSSLDRLTTSSFAVSVLRVTVAVVAPAPAASETDAAAIRSVSRGVSSSSTSNVSLPSA